MAESLVRRPGTAPGRDVLDMALVIPLQGPAGIFGPSCESCAALAAQEINAEGGVLGRELNLVPVDGGRSPAEVAVEVDALVSAGAVQAVTGWHISAVREAVAPRIRGRVPYAYTALYEGGEDRPGLFLTGETPDLQLGPTLDWFAGTAGVRRWMIVGDDYVWPRRSAATAARYLRRIGGTVCDEVFVPLGTSDFAGVLRRVEASGCEAVLMLLIGDDAVAFNRAFAAAGLDRDILRFSSLIEENVLLASGPESTRGLMTSAGYFEDLATSSGLEFAATYFREFGDDAPVLNSLGESCYEGVRLLTELMRRAGSTQVPAMMSVADGLAYESPRGTVELRDRHLQQKVFLAVADGLSWDVVQQL
ncbi:substrate-binding domain-containing protein [Actinomycetospora cinnamomea]|uniref:Amino acid/amide ABC transporter substrate-binding protein (HAAT family) n=1 Tax=Actinomycetospora cinnamomea TaxID=663609 RepID=A0A2U1EZN7_9PSEU|nr:substrate-binding domain-containing protein [Actinomycetospora cinnamomea]PVZ05359.1 amino acid/amide ABC transporter substrate-binding protein (HAAT family) [Actinomycetospora cinnamomea]